MKVAVFGASGIIGQFMRLAAPPDVTPVYVRRTADCLHDGLDLTDDVARAAFLEAERPDVIINLAGESNTDVVERDPLKYSYLNSGVPEKLADWCDANGAHLVQVSTQAVFSGDAPPYAPDSVRRPVNCYGHQKYVAEKSVQRHKNWTIVRPTFVLGVRPLPHVGRANPIEQMLGGQQRKQVNDRWFSVSFAPQVAISLWKVATERSAGIVHIGGERLSRFDIAHRLAHGAYSIEPASHDSFKGLAPRPKDTTYSAESDALRLGAKLEAAKEDFKYRSIMSFAERAREIALFLGKREDECLAQLNRGWDAIHNAVSADWNAANPQTDDEILDWYRKTESYIYELSFYHADPGWNYSGMCSGIAERLKAAGVKKVLCLGDGIGDLTISLIRAGFDATYHDLAGSRTAEFAAFRSWMHLGEYMPTRLSQGWAPDLGVEEWDAIVSLDFLEHCKGVPIWTQAIRDALKPNGLFVAQNAYGIGSGPDGSMPMHLAENDRYEKEWDPLLFSLGFTQEGPQWYRSPAREAVAA